MKKDTIKNKLVSLLGEPDINYSEIIKLSNELVKFDENYVRFSIDAAHISRLGKELVSRQETAVAELIKNAYDADASTVSMLYENTESPGGCLTITDTGNGMSREELVNGFMRISTSEKRHNPVSERYNRVRAGQKGIGRFAAQRLGNKLTIITQKKGDESALKVVIDWSEFKSDTDLSEIASGITLVPKTTQQGTTLRIEDLCDSWTEAQIRRVYRYVIELVQPFPLSTHTSSSKLDPGFKVTCEKSGVGGEKITLADDQTMFFDHALARIDGNVDNNGVAHWRVQSKLLNLDEASKLEHQDTEAFSDLKGVNFSTHYFIYTPEYIPRQLNAKLRNLGNEKGGIRVYRNGFRVRPYGESYNDWLRLDYSSSLRQILPPHSNQNFFGFVELHDPEGIHFEETASREGLIENDAYRQLVDFVSSALKSAVLRIAAARQKKQKPSQSGWNYSSDLSGEDESSALQEAKSKLHDLQTSFLDEFKEKSIPEDIEDGSDGNSLHSDRHLQSDSFSEVLGALERADDERQAMLEEIGMLRVLASLGLSIGEFTHEIKHYFPAIRLDVAALKATNDTAELTDRIDQNLNTIQSYASYFDTTVSANVSRERKPLELRDVISDFTKATSAIASRDSIIIQKEISGYDLFTTPMHYSEWASIFNNLFTNAKKAIKKSNIEGKILIKAGASPQGLFVEFSDNGCGIPIEIKDRIFDAFFTTSDASNGFSIESESIGTGLGLKLVTDILASSGGAIFISPTEPGYSTTFRLEIPAASPDEITKDDY